MASEVWFRNMTQLQDGIPETTIVKTPVKLALDFIAMVLLLFFLVAGLLLSSPIAKEVIIDNIVSFFRPSSFFSSLDTDHDNAISRFEWQAYYYETNIFYDMAYKHE